MDVRTGIDLVAVAAVQDALDAHGQRYLDRVYTPGEQAACGTDAERLAARFAAKEAVVKALRLAEGSFAWTDLEVVRHPAGHPEMRLSGGAGATASSLNVRSMDVSFSHEAGLATAVVVLTIFP